MTTAPANAGRYTLLEELGRGAMGVVYRAQDPVIGRSVAVKTVRLDAQAAGLSQEELVQRFQTEARAAGQLTHPNIVVVYDAGEADGLFYITMELVEGRSLQELMERREAFPLPRILRIMQQAGSALDFAHQNKVVHRDIKPANLMLTADDTVKITDFGTAKFLQYGTVQTAQVIGTPSYMSPEQIKGRPVDGRSDIFSLGVVLYELVTGEKPFPGETITTVIYKIVNEEPIAPRDLDSTIPPGLSAVISRALAKSPAARFQTCREFMEALQNFRDFNVSAAAPARAAQTAKLPAAAAMPASHRIPVLPAAPMRSGTTSPWLVVLLLALIGAAGYRVWPALQEVWQRSKAERLTTVLPTPPLPAPQPATESAPPSDAGTSLGGSPTPSADRASSELRPAGAKVTPKPAAGVRPASGASETAGGKSQSAEASTTKTPQDAEQAIPAAPAAKEPVAPEPPKLVTTPAATLLQRRIQSVLVLYGVGARVQVTAVGNSVTLTGKLSAKAHGKLVNWLQQTPTHVQIIDDIESADDAESPPAGPNAVPF